MPSATSRRPDPVRAKRKDMAAVTRVVGILGGMGPAAGAGFVRVFLQGPGGPRGGRWGRGGGGVLVGFLGRAGAQQMRARGEPVRDQSFPEHWLAQVPVPDRTGALVSDVSGAHQ